MLILGAILLFAVAAVFGIYLLSYVLAEKNTPKGVAMIHGLLGASGIVILLITSISYPKLFFSLSFFILAAIGGFVLISLDLLGKKIPKFLALGHGTIAIVGFILLLSLGLTYIH